MNTLRGLSRLQRPLLLNLRCNTATITKPIIVLGIETSCDDTSAAIVASDRRILSESVRHQHADHEPMGGIVPSIAAKRHMENLPAVICEALDGAGMKVEDLDAIAVTRGPGLPPCLAVGVNAAKTLAAVMRSIDCVVAHTLAWEFFILKCCGVNHGNSVCQFQKADHRCPPYGPLITNSATQISKFQINRIIVYHRKPTL